MWPGRSNADDRPRVCRRGVTRKPGSTEHEPPGRYPVFAVTVDVVILSVVERRLEVLLVQRGGEPFQGWWALPGGFKRPDETLDDAAARELVEETGVRSPRRLTQFGAYGDPGRDPRGNVVSVGYLAITPDVGPIVAGTDAAEARMVPVAEVLDGTPALAFDHRPHPRRRRRARPRRPRRRRPRHRLRRSDLHPQRAAERVRGHLGRTARSRQLPSEHGRRLPRSLRRAHGRLGAVRAEGRATTRALPARTCMARRLARCAGRAATTSAGARDDA